MFIREVVGSTSEFQQSFLGLKGDFPVFSQKCFYITAWLDLFQVNQTKDVREISPVISDICYTVTVHYSIL